MYNLLFIFFSAASSGLLFVANGQTNWNSLGCNNFEGKYGVNYCYADASLHSEKYVCLSDSQLAVYEYYNPDCSGDPSYTYYYGDNSTSSSHNYAYFQCNTSSSCDFAILEEFHRLSKCSSNEREDTVFAYLTDVCVLGAQDSDDIDSYESYMASCSGKVITVEEYDNQDCSDTAANTRDININNFTDSDLYEYQIYCSSDGGYGRCTETLDTNWDKLGCNNLEGFYSIDYCYGAPFGGSTKIECLSDNRLARYEYNNSVCSGSPSDTLYYGDNATYSWYDSSYFQCNASSSCAFTTLEMFYAFENCAADERYWSNVELLTDLCVTTDPDEFFFDSYMASCERNQIIRKAWYNDYCEGTPADVVAIDLNNASDYVGVMYTLYNYKFYCSSDSGYGSCGGYSGAEKNGSRVLFVSIILFLAHLFAV